MASNNSRPDSVSSDAAVAAKGSQSDSRNSDIDSDDDYDEPVEEEEEEDTDDPSDDESDYSADNDGTEKPLSGPDSYRKDASGRGDEEEEVDDNTPETNVRRFMEALEGRRVKLREEKEDHDYVFYEDLFNFPKDQERWTEEDLQEFWGEAPLKSTKPGWDPVLADKEDWQIVNEEIQAGRDPPIAPFYVPYYKNYPAIPDNHHDIANPKSVIEELDRVEEFLTWVSYIFPDGSSYEGTVWDDLANGKGVYVAEQGLVRYEGEWLQNLMDGHGVVEVEIPDIQPRPGSKLEAKMRAEGKIIKRDFMSPEDQKWLDMDIEDSVRFTTGHSEVPFYENDTWIQVFGEKPEKGRYKYAGQWKHGRMHGCGVYEVNEHIIYGRFYFGEYLDESSGCDADISGLHAGIAEVAAAKARMFVNKPDGMVREERGPYGDPQHPYFYEEEDVWMAPGFVNQFYETPDYWKTYLEEVDKEREMWLNSFYKAPLRIPMPAELEYWWETDESPEFVLINKEPVPDPEDPSRFVYSEDPLILHTRTGRLINYVEDEKYGVRLFWQPPLKEGENVNPDNVEFLPLGFDEFYGRAKPAVKKENWLTRLVTSFESAIKPKLAQLEDWLADKKKASELNLKLIEHEIDLVEAEICLEEEIEDFESELKRKQKEEEKRASEMDLLDESSVSSVRGVDSDEEDEDEGEDTPSSFGIASTKNSEKVSKEDKKGRQPGNSPFSSLSLSFGTFASATQVPKKILDSFLSRNRNNQPPVARHCTSYTDIFKVDHTESASSISYPRKIDQSVRLRIARNRGFKPYMTDKNNIGHTVLAAGTVFRRSKDVNPFRNTSLHANCGIQGGLNLEKDPLCVLSWHVPVGPPQKCDILNMST